MKFHSNLKYTTVVFTVLLVSLVPSVLGAVVAYIPPPLDQTLTFTAISAGRGHFMALTSDGDVVVWGENMYGQCNVPAGLKATAIGTGGWHSFAITPGGGVVGWGYNGSGQCSPPPSLIGKTVVAIGGGEFHSVALTSEGKVVAWGDNGSGQCNVPSSLTDKTVTAIAVGLVHTLALTSEGEVVTWGVDTIPPSLIGKTVTAIAAGETHSMALTSDGEIVAWGSNGYGQCNVPSSLTGKTVTAIAAGGWNSFAITSDGAVTVWGRSYEYDQSNVPAGLDAIAIAGCEVSCIVLEADGSLVTIPIPTGYTPYSWDVPATPKPTQSLQPVLPYSEQRSGTIEFLLMCWKALAFVGVICVVIFLLMNGSQDSSGGI